ncbi:MAG TPA: hypothetical protein VGP68_14515 [Gemmataceae bacterium]|jgi:phage gpG-like protein|nr:hypothetical protein [Gemmataceae bacterium]
MTAALSSGSFAPAFKQNIELIHKSVGVNFASTSSPDGGEWPARKKVGDGHPLLIESGDLFQSATSDFGLGSVNDIGDREASTGVDPTEVPYAATQNFGDPSRNIPQREFEDVDEATLDEMAERIADRGIELLF